MSKALSNFIALESLWAGWVSDPVSTNSINVSENSWNSLTQGPSLQCVIYVSPWRKPQLFTPLFVLNFLPDNVTEHVLVLWPEEWNSFLSIFACHSLFYSSFPKNTSAVVKQYRTPRSLPKTWWPHETVIIGNELTFLLKCAPRMD